MTAIERLHLRIDRLSLRNTTCNGSMHISRVSLSLLQSMDPKLVIIFL
jgi:hypothetical protein